MSGLTIPKGKGNKVVSCAECRRLKLKCDREFPCSSCRKRGLAALCPHDSLQTRPRKRASSPKLSESEMSRRIRQLEDALRSVHAVHSTLPHPLLDNSGTRHTPTDRTSDSKSDRSESPVEGDLDRLEESLGTLTIDPQSGKSSFFGQSAGMESLYHTDLREETELPEVQPGSSTPFDPLRDFVLNPLSPRIPSEVIMLHLEEHLPDPLRAWGLCDFYFNNAAWLYSPIPRHQFQDEILLPVYCTTPPSLINSSLTHIDASILFMVFAIGALLDSPGSTDSGSHSSHAAAEQRFLTPDTFHQLSRAALTAGVSVIEEPSISGVRSIFLMAYYHLLLDRKQTPQTVWSLASIAVSLAISIGLHRDGERWKLDPAVIEQRRSLFWELNVCLGFLGEYFFFFIADPLYLNYLIIGLAFGRPPQITLPFVDCKVGPDPEQSINADGKVVHGYSYRIHFITSTILSEVRDIVLSTNQNYIETLALDRKVRDCAIELFGAPIGCRQVGPEVLKGSNTVDTMQNFFLLALKETMMLYLHRKYFVRACSSRPEDLATSRYYPSLLAAFRSAQVIADILESLLNLEPILPCHFWFFWTHTLASAIILGSVAIRHPRSVLALEGMKALEKILDILQHCANRSERIDRPTRALKVVTKLRERARLAISQPERGEKDMCRSDELKVLGGHARVVSMTAASRPSYATNTATATPTATKQSYSPPMDTSMTTDMHPSLMEDVAVVRRQDQDRDTRMGLEKLFEECPAIYVDPSRSTPGPRSATASTSGITPSPVEALGTFPDPNVQQPLPYAHVGSGLGEIAISQFEDNTAGDRHPEYFPPSDPNAASCFVGQQRQHHVGASADDDVAIVDNFGNIFSIAPSTAQEWGLMMSDDYTDACWQDFVPGLGVTGAGLG